MPSEQSLLQTSGARTVFGVFNDSSRARLFLDLGREVDDVSAVAKWKYVHNMKTDGYAARPFAMTKSQRQQKKTN